MKPLRLALFLRLEKAVPGKGYIKGGLLEITEHRREFLVQTGQAALAENIRIDKPLFGGDGLAIEVPLLLGVAFSCFYAIKAAKGHPGQDDAALFDSG